MDALTIIENRIEQLESKLGYPDEENSEKSVVENLTSAESILNSTTSGREKIAEINKRIEELNSYLDPQYVNLVNEAKLKANYVFTNEPNIRHHCEYMKLCQEKSSVLSSDSMSNIAVLTETLEKMKAVNMENKDQCDHVAKCVQQAMESYSQISSSVIENLAALTKQVDAIEMSKS